MTTCKSIDCDEPAVKGEDFCKECLTDILEIQKAFNGPAAPLGFVTQTSNLELDPNGNDPHQPGAKLDLGKAEYDMFLFSFPNAAAAVDRIGKFGARKYTKGGFLEVPNGQVRYSNALMRHHVKHLQGELTDPDSGELHLAHKAWNALAELELYLRGKGT
jgi:hypothetical protein